MPRGRVGWCRSRRRVLVVRYSICTKAFISLLAFYVFVRRLFALSVR